MHDGRVIQAHLFGEQPRGLGPLFIVFNGQSERKLHLAVVHGIAIGTHRFGVKGFVKIIFADVIQSRTHTCQPPFISGIKGLM